MLRDLTIESVTICERGTNMVDDIYCTIKFVEMSANRISEDEFSRTMWTRLDNEEFGELGFPPTHYPQHPLTEAEETAKVRAERDDLLLKSDWTQIPGNLSDAKKAEWATYRTALRDISSQVTFPYEITWPTKP